MIADMTNLKFNSDGTKFFIVDTHNENKRTIDTYTTKYSL